MTEYEFTPEAVGESFAEHFPGMASEMAENDVTPEMLAEYLNAKIDQSGRQALAAMFSDHNIPIELGGEIQMREHNSFEEWKKETDWSPHQE